VTSFYKIRQTTEWSDIKEADPRTRDTRNRVSSGDVLGNLAFADVKTPLCDVTLLEAHATAAQVNACVANKGAFAFISVH
jgi:hypothetical protein